MSFFVGKILCLRHIRDTIIMIRRLNRLFAFGKINERFAFSPQHTQQPTSSHTHNSDLLTKRTKKSIDLLVSLHQLHVVIYQNQQCHFAQFAWKNQWQNTTFLVQEFLAHRRKRPRGACKSQAGRSFGINDCGPWNALSRKFGIGSKSRVDTAIQGNTNNGKVQTVQKITYALAK